MSSKILNSMLECDYALFFSFKSYSALFPPLLTHGLILEVGAIYVYWSISFALSFPKFYFIFLFVLYSFPLTVFESFPLYLGAHWGTMKILTNSTWMSHIQNSARHPTFSGYLKAAIPSGRHPTFFGCFTTAIISGRHPTFSGYLTAAILSGWHPAFSRYLTAAILSGRHPTFSGYLTIAILSGRHSTFSGYFTSDACRRMGEEDDSTSLGRHVRILR